MSKITAHTLVSILLLLSAIGLIFVVYTPAEANNTPTSTTYLPLIARSLSEPAPYPPPVPPPEPSNTPLIAGIMGVPPANFAEMSLLHANTVEYRGSTNATLIQSAFEDARAQNLMFLVRGPDRTTFTTPDGHLDFTAIDNLLRTMFDGTTLIGDPAFIGFYLLDEPCHPTKYNLTGAEVAQLYERIKAYNPDLNLFINFGKLSDCLDAFLAESNGAPVTDIAAFTMTTLKSENARYLPAQLDVAQQAKALDPNLRVVPMLAVWEGTNMPLPTEQWVRETGQRLAGEPLFDGLLIYPWTTPSWATRSLDDVIDLYADDVRAVFDAVTTW